MYIVECTANYYNDIIYNVIYAYLSNPNLLVWCEAYNFRIDYAINFALTEKVIRSFTGEGTQVIDTLLLVIFTRTSK